MMKSGSELEHIRTYQRVRLMEKQVLATIPAIRHRIRAMIGKEGYSFQLTAAHRFPGYRMAEDEEISLEQLSWRQWVELSRIASNLSLKEREEWERVRHEVSAALSPIIEGIYGLVVKMRLRLAPGYYSLADDLDAEGVIGVIRALERFNPESGTPFSSYCTYWITAMMLRAMEANQTVRIPEDARVLRRKALDIMDHCVGISRWEIAKELCVSEALLDAALSSMQSVDALILAADGTEIGKVEEILIVDNGEGAICEYDRKVLMERVERIVSNLNPDVREAALLRFPFVDDPPHCSRNVSLFEAVDILRRDRLSQLEALIENEGRTMDFRK